MREFTFTVRIPTSIGRRVPTMAVVLALTLLPVSHAFHGSSAAAAAAWSTVTNETFEGTFPGSGWSISDYNGSVGGDVSWDDVEGGYQSTWAAHPTDGSPYTNLAHTFMMYGPFSLAGAKDARMTFRYWLDTEPYYDTFTYGYSCNSRAGPWQQTTVSGSSGAWKAVTVSLKKCVKKTQVFVHFGFISDSSFNKPGVWVDNVMIQKR